MSAQSTPASDAAAPHPSARHFWRASAIALPEIGAALLATPKAGCTAVKWWLWHARAAIDGAEGGDLARWTRGCAEPRHELCIHWAWARRLQEQPALAARPDRADLPATYALVRNPYTRVFSAWASKLAEREPGHAWPYRLDAALFPQSLSAAEIARAFEAFVRRVAREERGLWPNIHWAPQAVLLQPGMWPGLRLLRAEQLAEDLQPLAQRLAEAGAAPPPLRRYNESLLPYRPEYVSEVAAGLIGEVYAEDFRLGGYALQPPPASARAPVPEAGLELGLARIAAAHDRLGEALAEREAAAAQARQARLQWFWLDRRLLAAQQRVEEERLHAQEALERERERLGAEIAELRRQLSAGEAEMGALLRSRSWRITAPLRAAGDGLRRVRQALRRGGR